MMFPLSLLALYLGASFAVHAEGMRPPEPDWHSLGLALSLSTEQLTDFEVIMHSQHEKRMALQREAREAQRPAMEALREETRSRLSGVLTPDQLARFEVILAFHRPPRPEDREGEMPPADNTPPVK
ncbi:MAG: hypothetical protein HYV16_16155 [Gammaproteobacteria bacterium]|nr:hypothetical protein [Gammaproteobacteria bacterium]